MNKSNIDWISNLIQEIPIMSYGDADSTYIMWDDADKAASKILEYLWEEGLLVHTEPSN